MNNAQIVLENWRYYDGVRYSLIAWCIMQIIVMLIQQNRLFFGEIVKN